MDSYYQNICEHGYKDYCHRDCHELNKPFRKVFVMRMTPVDMPLKQGELIPESMKRHVEHDLDLFGLAIVMKTKYNRMSHGQSKMFDEYTWIPAESLTILETKLYSKHSNYITFKR